jgi:lipoprotein-anchoring transpeptidase ErfK/SrfK
MTALRQDGHSTHAFHLQDASAGPKAASHPGIKPARLRAEPRRLNLIDLQSRPEEKAMPALLSRTSLIAIAAAFISLLAPIDDAVAARRGAKAVKPAAPLSRPIVDFSPDVPIGAIIVVNQQRRLYYVHEKGKAMIYPVAIGKPSEQWTGVSFVQGKATNPSWTKPETGVRMPGGGNNPLGARALYLGWTLYRIHGTNSPNSIGSAASNGCFRMFNDHVKDLYARVHVGAPVYVVNDLSGLKIG